jgi:hypothetical protein
MFDRPPSFRRPIDSAIFSEHCGEGSTENTFVKGARPERQPHLFRYPRHPRIRRKQRNPFPAVSASRRSGSNLKGGIDIAGSILRKIEPICSAKAIEPRSRDVLGRNFGPPGLHDQVKPIQLKLSKPISLVDGICGDFVQCIMIYHFRYNGLNLEEEANLLHQPTEMVPVLIVSF